MWRVLLTILFVDALQGKMVIQLAKDPSARLLKHVVRCYLRLSDNSRAREALRQCLPDQLRDTTFHHCLAEDKSSKHWLANLLKNLEPGGGSQNAQGGGGGGGADQRQLGVLSSPGQS